MDHPVLIEIAAVKFRLTDGAENWSVKHSFESVRLM